MFAQLLTPVAGALLPSFLVALLPIITVLLMLGAWRRPVWQASAAGLAVGAVVSVSTWHFPVLLALDAIAGGAVFALWPIMWVVFNALLLFNVAVASGSFGAFRNWLIDHLPDDRRIVLVVVGFCFSALLEGVAGFGTPVAITSSLLIMAGFPATEALVFTLIFNTAPVAFAALGVPITVLGAVTHLTSSTLAAMVGRQLPLFSLLLPFYVILLYGGLRSVRALWPVLLIAGSSFAVTQFACSNFGNYAVTDVLSSLVSLAASITFLQRWTPVYDPAFAVLRRPAARDVSVSASLWHAWAPWIIVSLIVIIWTGLAVPRFGEVEVLWPGLHDMVSITLYKGQAYDAIWNFQPLSTGTAILLAAIVTALSERLPFVSFVRCIGVTWRQSRVALLSVVLIIGLASLMNYSGLNYTLGLGVASAGPLFVFLSPFLGWAAVLLSGSDTAGNALFGNLQVVAAKQLDLSPVLLAASNASGGVMGKMISPQSLATGTALVNLKGGEYTVFRRTFPHSIALTALLGLIVAIEQYLIPWIIPRV